MHILMSGGTGFIGQALVPVLLAEGHSLTLWVRSEAKLRRLYGDSVSGVASLDLLGDDVHIDAVINLAGEGIADARWSESRKQLLLNSRLGVTDALVALIERLQNKPAVLLSGSAIGYYGSQPSDRVLTEDAEPHDEFAHELCRRWEESALRAEASGVRVCLLRTGIVLGNGGALAKMLPPFRFGLGGRIASGEQAMSWIHLQDELAIIVFLLKHPECSGAYNLTAPGAVSNAEFTAELGRALHRPAILPLPALVPGLMLGEGAVLLLKGQRVYPKRIEDAGYRFSYPELPAALEAVMAEG
ncbi:TIGR01777 family oxidoreductase [Aliamphritea hakodatensis]|uniref:TIGR01777 family oxidoreductase n=1 Tax=Aliamphritea hakodatensis TaxID=2895352 RepID=UPI0022FDA519|nr:TIGR01777 family oxidoreductase [Aliamphritea hakodatensis]